MHSRTENEPKRPHCAKAGLTSMECIFLGLKFLICAKPTPWTPLSELHAWTSTRVIHGVVLCNSFRTARSNPANDGGRCNAREEYASIFNLASMQWRKPARIPSIRILTFSCTNSKTEPRIGKSSANISKDKIVAPSLEVHMYPVHSQCTSFGQAGPLLT